MNFVENGDSNVIFKCSDDKKNIFLIGIRSSSMLADFMNHYLGYMFGNVKMLFSNSTNELFEQIFRISEGDVLIAISFPRYSSRTKLAAEFAKKI